MDSVESSAVKAASSLRSWTSAVLENPSLVSGLAGVCESHKRANATRNNVECRGMPALTGHRSTSTPDCACGAFSRKKLRRTVPRLRRNERSTR